MSPHHSNGKFFERPKSIGRSRIDVCRVMGHEQTLVHYKMV